MSTTPIARFPSAAEAVALQAALAEAGIESVVFEENASITPSEAARVEVAEADAAKAREVFTQFRGPNEERGRQFEATHPAKGYPFVGIWILVTVVLLLLEVALVSYWQITAPERSGFDGWRDIIVAIPDLLKMPIFYGFIAAIAFFPVWWGWKKFQTARALAAAAAAAEADAANEARRGERNF